MSAFYGTESVVPSGAASGSTFQAQSALGSVLGSVDEREERRRRSSLPQGRDLELTQSVLKEFAQLTAQHRMADARALLASVHPEEDHEHPAFLHVIGAGSSALDEWSSLPEFKAAARNVKLLKWSKPASKAARELLDASLNRQAFDRLQAVVATHGWDAAFEGVAVATSSLLGSIARKRGSNVTQMASRLLPDASAPVPRRASWKEGATEAPSASSAPESHSGETAPARNPVLDSAVDHALRETPVVAGLSALVEWIGAGRAVTASGQLRRADIGAAASMLGLHAVGVAKRPAESENGTLQDAGDPLQVRSAADVTALVLWWDVLIRGEVLTLDKTRVTVADAASKYTGTTSVQDLEGFVAAFVLWSMNSLLEAEAASAKKSAVPAAEAAAQVGRTLVEAANTQAPVPGVTERSVPQGAAQAAEILFALEDVQILGRTAQGALSVPLGLRNAVLNAVAGMKAYAPEAFDWFTAN